MKIRNIFAAAALGASSLAAALALAVPASASVPGTSAVLAGHTPFTVTDNGGALVTRQPLTVHQVVYSGGIAETVQTAQGGNGTWEITVTPALPASDQGKTVLFST